MSQFSLNEIQPINTTCARIPINLLKSEHSKIVIVKNPNLGSASKITTKGGDSWTTPKSQFSKLKPLVDALGRCLTIWDPFYMNGKAGEYMKQVFGCKIIHEDRLISLTPFEIPEFAVKANLIITNPPFSKSKEVLKWLISLKKPFMALLPDAVATNSGTNDLIADNRVQLLRVQGRIAFENDRGILGKSGSRNTQWYCFGLSLPAELVQFSYVGKLDGKTQDVKQLVFPKRTVVQSKYPISNRPRVQHLMTVIEKKLDIVSFKKNKSERDKKKRQFSNLWQFKLGHSTQALGAGGHKTPHNFKKGRGVCIRPIVERNYPKWKKELYLACDDLINEIDPEFAKDGHYAVNFSCMTDAQKHFVKVHTDSHDISHQYGIVLGNTKGGRLTCWNKNGTTQTVDYHRKILKMDGRLQHAVGNFTGKRYCVIFYKLYDPRKTCSDPIFAPARLI